MYKDFGQLFRPDNMKKGIVEYVDKCLTRQRMKVEHQHPVRERKPLKIPTWKCDSILMDIVIGLPFLLQRRMLFGSLWTSSPNLSILYQLMTVGV